MAYGKSLELRELKKKITDVTNYIWYSSLQGTRVLKNKANDSIIKVSDVNNTEIVQGED